MPQLLARSIEFQRMRAGSKREAELLRKLRDDERIREMLPKQVSKQNRNQNLKPILLILGYLYQDEIVNDECFKGAIDTIRKLGPSEINLMIETGSEILQQSMMGARVQKLTAKTFESLINFNQFIV